MPAHVFDPLMFCALWSSLISPGILALCSICASALRFAAFADLARPPLAFARSIACRPVLSLDRQPRSAWDAGACGWLGGWLVAGVRA